jgi:hypothetical protein
MKLKRILLIASTGINNTNILMETQKHVCRYENSKLKQDI